jgi:LacI family transcriptional regulator
MADGIIFSRTEPQDERVTLCLDNNFPFVSYGRTELPTPHPYVDYDNFAFAYAATKRLASKGRKKLCIIMPPTNFTFGHHLRDGFFAAVKELGVAHEISETMTLDSPADQIRLAIIARIGQPDAPDAPDGYICSGDAAAMAVMAGITDAGKVIGTDIDVIAKQTSPIFSLMRPKVDSIYEDTALAGEQMGRLLIRRIAGEPAEALQFLDRPDVRF